MALLIDGAVRVRTADVRSPRVSFRRADAVTWVVGFALVATL